MLTRNQHPDNPQHSHSPKRRGRVTRVAAVVATAAAMLSAVLYTGTGTSHADDARDITVRVKNSGAYGLKIEFQDADTNEDIFRKTGVNTGKEWVEHHIVYSDTNLEIWLAAELGNHNWHQLGRAGDDANGVYCFETNGTTLMFNSWEYDC